MTDADRLRAAADRLDALAVTHQQQTALAPTAALLRAVADLRDVSNHQTDMERPLRSAVAGSLIAAADLADAILGDSDD